MITKKVPIPDPTPEEPEPIIEPEPEPLAHVKNISIPTNREIQEYIEYFGFNPFEVAVGG